MRLACSGEGSVGVSRHVRWSAGAAKAGGLAPPAGTRTVGRAPGRSQGAVLAVSFGPREPPQELRCRHDRPLWLLRWRLQRGDSATLSEGSGRRQVAISDPHILKINKSFLMFQPGLRPYLEVALRVLGVSAQGRVPGLPCCGQVARDQSHFCVARGAGEAPRAGVRLMPVGVLPWPGHCSSGAQSPLLRN